MLRSGITSYQMFSYILTLIMLPITMLVCFPMGTPYLSVGVCLTYIYMYIIVIHLTIKDSCLPELIRKIKEDGFKRLDFKPEIGRHVIENNHCNICDVTVEKETKHCKKCNYCVGKFDHHCVWLNNCIGGVNYRNFITLIVSIASFSLGSFLLSAFLIVSWFSQTKPLYLQYSLGDKPEYLRLIWVFCCIICIFIYLLCFLTTFHLLYFHIRLYKLGMTTYKFIVSRRKNKVSSLGTISTVSRTIRHI